MTDFITRREAELRETIRGLEMEIADLENSVSVLGRQAEDESDHRRMELAINAWAAKSPANQITMTLVKVSADESAWRIAIRGIDSIWAISLRQAIEEMYRVFVKDGEITE